jgi:hypothetical protein
MEACLVSRGTYSCSKINQGRDLNSPFNLVSHLLLMRLDLLVCVAVCVKFNACHSTHLPCISIVYGWI